MNLSFPARTALPRHALEACRGWWWRQEESALEMPGGPLLMVHINNNDVNVR